jgi:hypothetical protein
MSVRYFERKELEAALTSKLQPAEIVLDIGCGIRPQRLIRPRIHLCAEPFHQYAELLQRNRAEFSDRDLLVLQVTWAGALDVLPEKSVDTVFLIDVIEHLEKGPGVELLARTERLARKQIVIFTPLGFMPQYHPDGIDAWGLDGGAWQEHKSGWLPSEFDDAWELMVAEQFHLADNLGRKLSQPFGAFWAVKNLEPVVAQSKFPVRGRKSPRIRPPRNAGELAYDLLHRAIDRMKLVRQSRSRG